MHSARLAAHLHLLDPNLLLRLDERGKLLPRAALRLAAVVPAKRAVITTLLLLEQAGDPIKRR